MAEYEINLENLVRMKRVFEEADQDGSGELDPDEFYEKLGPYLGQGLTPAAVSQLFMRIDADCGGTIDWQEFINYFFLQRATSSAADSGDDWRLHAEDHWRKEWRGAGHKETVERVYCCTPLGQYISGGRGGALRVWNADSLAPVQTLNNGAGWVTDCAYVEGPSNKRLVVAAQDRTMSFYEPVRSTFEFSSRLACPGSMGPPQCLAELQRDVDGAGAPHLVWGDTDGSVMLLKADPPPLHTERQMVPKRDFEVLHSGHTDWVTHVQHIPDVGLVSSSLDATLCMLDLERGVLAGTVGCHKKGVRSFAYSPAFSLVASGGVERSVLLWQPKGNVNKPVGELPGHASGVARLVVADEQSQVITLAEDHVVRVWDLRNHKCVQAIAHTDWMRPEDSKPTAMTYDTTRRRLVCASHRPVVWSHKRVEVERQHDARLVGALYNQTFSVMVSGDEGGTICMWNVKTGRREGGFSLHSQPASAGAMGSTTSRRGSGTSATLAPAALPKLTAITFDNNQRRLLTALDKGAVRVYNFNSGAVLHEFLSRETRQELTAVAFVPHTEEPDAQEAEAEAGDGGSSVSGASTARQTEWTPGDGEAEVAEAAEELQQQGADAGGFSELSEHALMLRQQQDQQCAQNQQQAEQGQPAEQDEDGGSSKGSSRVSAAGANLVLATGWGRSLCVWEEGEEARNTRCRRLSGHGADVLCMALLGRDIAATGDFDGVVRVWHLPSSACIATSNYGGAEFERAVRRLCWLPTKGTAACTPRTPRTPAAPPLLLVAGDNGSLQFWQVPLGDAATSWGSPSSPGAAVEAEGQEALPNGPADCRLVASMPACHRRSDCLSALLLEKGEGGTASLLWTGDSSGHVALWDLTGMLAACRAPAAAGAGAGAGSLQLPALAIPQRLVHWRASGGSIVSLEFVQAAGQRLLLVGGQDATIGIWTRQGGLVGVFGRHNWELEDPATWQDPQAHAVPPPLPAEEGGSGLTPREIIASTPRRSNWVGRVAVSARQQGAAGGALTARGGPQRSGSQTARQLGASSRPQTAAREGIPGAASAPPTARSVVEAANERQAELLARLTQLRMPTPEERAGRFSPPPPSLAEDAPPPLALHHTAAGGAAGRSGASLAGTAVRQFLSPESAGARLSALAAEVAASKVNRWSLPVHVQAHSALALQRMDDVPADTAAMWEQTKAHIGGGGGGGRQERCGGSRSSISSPAGKGARPASPQVSIAAIMGRASSAFGRRTPQPKK